MKKFNVERQRFYSVSEEERLYSTGCDELDDLLEKAFCEGYEYAQKEFGVKEFLKKGFNQVKNSPEGRSIVNSAKDVARKQLETGAEIFESGGRYYKVVGDKMVEISNKLPGAANHALDYIRNGASKAVKKGSKKLREAAAKGGEEMRRSFYEMAEAARDEAKNL